METELVRLVYERDGGTEFYTGFVGYGQHETNFKSASFQRMMEMTGEALRDHPEARLLIKRVEAPYPMTLPPRIEELLRSDIKQAMAALTVPDQKIVVAGVRHFRPKNMTRAALGSIRHGHDTLADGFGEMVYLRVDRSNHKIEDPVTGRWVQMAEPDGAGVFYLGSLQLGQIIKTEVAWWVAVRTADLLTIKSGRFYLPRAWNQSPGKWITREALTEMYEQYKKEKANVSHQ